ncbi:MAG: aspartate aminotransferase family protein, partial [Candidatus Limnocylindria bacterium]
GGGPLGACAGGGVLLSVIESLPDARGGGRGLEQSTTPGGATRVAHLGTFNGNPLSMAAGVAVLTKILTRDVYPGLHSLADRLTAGSQAVVDEFGLPGYAINSGPKGCVMFTPERVTNYRDFIGLDGDLWEASFFFLANRGILLPPGPDDQWTLSVQHTEDEIDRYVGTFREFAEELTA